MPEKLSENQKIMLKEMEARAKYEKNQVKKTPEGIEMTEKKGSNMPEARCPKCGKHYHGWSLLDPKHQICPKCGAKLEINQEKGKKK